MPVIWYGNVFKVYWRKTTTSIISTVHQNAENTLSLPLERYIWCITIASCFFLYAMDTRKKAQCFRVAIGVFVECDLSFERFDASLFYSDWIYWSAMALLWFPFLAHIFCYFLFTFNITLNLFKSNSIYMLSFLHVLHANIRPEFFFLVLLERHMFFCLYLICICMCLVLAADLAIVFKYWHVHLVAFFCFGHQHK